MAELPINLNTVPVKCSDCPIRERAVCRYCTPDQLTQLDHIKFYRDYAPGQEIIGEGETVEALGSVVTGVAALHKSLADGRRQTVGLLFASDFIGRPLREVAPYDAVAVTPVKMCLFNRRKFETLMQSHGNLERRLLEMMLDELDAARDWMLLLGRKSAREKVASFLMILARRAAANWRPGMGEDLRFTLPLTREAIAEYLGLTIETVSRQFTALRKDAIIRVQDQREIAILDIEALADVTQDEVPEVLMKVIEGKGPLSLSSS